MTVSPDEGMMLLQQRMAGRHAVAAADPAAPDDAGGGGLDIMVRLAAAVEANTAEMRRGAKVAEWLWDQVHVISIPGNQSAVAGTLDDPDRWGPRAGFAWQVMGIPIVMGSGTTSWSVWEDSANDPTNIQLTQTVSGRWEPSDYFLTPNSRLVYTSVGGGITVGKGKAVEVALNALPGYLGLKLSGRI